MASKSGSRSSGTDGSDFCHREKVANQYNISPFLKKRLRFVYLCHVFVWLVILLKLVPEICRKLQITLPIPKTVQLPSPEIWEFVWFLGSLTPTMFGYLSLSRNRLFLLRLSMVGTLIFGFIPISVGVCLKALELYDFYQTKISQSSIFGLPLVVVWYIFFCGCIQIHGFSLYFGMKLVHAWTNQVYKKNY